MYVNVGGADVIAWSFVGFATTYALSAYHH